MIGRESQIKTPSPTNSARAPGSKQRDMCRKDVHKNNNSRSITKLLASRHTTSLLPQQLLLTTSLSTPLSAVVTTSMTSSMRQQLRRPPSRSSASRYSVTVATAQGATPNTCSCRTPKLTLFCVWPGPAKIGDLHMFWLSYIYLPMSLSTPNPYASPLILTLHP